jgi:DNA repair protein RadC
MEYIREVNVMYKSTRRGAKICDASTAAKEISAALPNNCQEHFIALYLDGSHKVAARAVLTTGLANCCQIAPREVFQRAVLCGAIAVIVGHNHPSGEVIPSPEDRAVTKRLKDAGEILGIRILDHIIVSDSDRFSFAENNQL